PDQGRFSGAVRAEVAEGHAAGNTQIDVVDGEPPVEALCQGVRLDGEVVGAVMNFMEVGSHGSKVRPGSWRRLGAVDEIRPTFDSTQLIRKDEASSFRLCRRGAGR